MFYSKLIAIHSPGVLFNHVQKGNTPIVLGILVDTHGFEEDCSPAIIQIPAGDKNKMDQLHQAMGWNWPKTT